MTILRLKALIDKTHKHGVQLEAEIKRHARGSLGKRALLAGLKALNAKRRLELARLEHKRPTPAPKPQPPAPALRFTMFDAANANTALPTTNPAAIAGYVNGAYQTFNALVKRFPKAKALSISVFSGGDARCLDIETGDATPADAPAWVRRQHARGIKRPVVYANTSTMPAVIAALTASGIHRGEYLVWTAHYTGVAHIEPGSDATQYKNVEQGASNYDVSLCESYFL